MSEWGGPNSIDANNTTFNFYRCSGLNVECKPSNRSTSDYCSRRDNLEVPKCCEKAAADPNVPLNRSTQRYRDEFAECHYSACGCDFRADNSQSKYATNNEKTIQYLDVSDNRYWFDFLLLMCFVLQGSKDAKVVKKNEQDDYEENILTKLYDRIATLERDVYGYKMDFKRLTMIINKISIASQRDRGGILVWQIDDFEGKVQAMLNSPVTMFYSPDFYTDPYGYRFCARISLSSKIKTKDTLSFHVHMMQSENDYHLDWPFRGCIQISMINKDAKLTQRDKIMTNEKSTAFQRPTNEISAHSFGFTEYANINSIMKDGFLSSDGKLTIKLRIGIVWANTIYSLIVVFVCEFYTYYASSSLLLAPVSWNQSCVDGKTFCFLTQ